MELFGSSVSVDIESSTIRVRVTFRSVHSFSSDSHNVINRVFLKTTALAY